MRVALVVVAVGCHAAPAPQPVPIDNPGKRARVCQISPQASMAPAHGGYRRLPDEVARLSLHGAIVDAEAKHPRRARQIGGTMFVALQAALRDLGDDQRTCLRAADADAANHRYSLEVVVIGERFVGAMVEKVRVRKIVDIGIGRDPFEVPTSAEACIAALLSSIELPPSDGPGTLRATLRTSDRCTSR